MSPTNVAMLVAVLAPVAAIFLAHRRRPALSVPRLGSRMEYPVTWRIMGVVFLGSAALLLGMAAVGPSKGDFDTSMLMGLVLAVSGAYTSVESFGTRFVVSATGLEKHALFRCEQVSWSDIRTMQVGKGQDSVTLGTLSTQITVPVRLLNLAAFAREALAGIPQDVQQASPAAVHLIGTWRG